MVLEGGNAGQTRGTELPALPTVLGVSKGKLLEQVIKWSHGGERKQSEEPSVQPWPCRDTSHSLTFESYQRNPGEGQIHGSQVGKTELTVEMDPQSSTTNI